MKTKQFTPPEPGQSTEAERAIYRTQNRARRVADAAIRARRARATQGAIEVTASKVGDQQVATEFLARLKVEDRTEGGGTRRGAKAARAASGAQDEAPVTPAAAGGVFDSSTLDLSELTQGVNGKKKKRQERAAGSGLFGALPPPPSVVPIELFGSPFELPSGCISLHASTGVGKSITGVCLANGIVPVGGASLEVWYLSVFEPGSPLLMQSGVEVKTLADVSFALFSDASVFLEVPIAKGRTGKNRRPDLEVYLAGRKPGRRAVLIFDSLTEAVQSYKLEERKGQPTMAGGAQPMDATFFANLNQFAQSMNLTIFSVVNDSRVPFSPRFEAVTQGIGHVVAPGVLSMKTRSSGRTPITFKASKAAVNAAAAALGYPTQTKGKTKARTGNVYGFDN